MNRPFQMLPAARAAFVFAAAAILLVAGAFKLGDVVAGRSAQGLLVAIPSTLIGTLAIIEVLLGGWLFSGFNRDLSQRLAACTFAVFCFAAAASAVRHDTTCGCFGSIDVAPWATATVDAILAVGLFFTAPPLEKARGFIASLRSITSAAASRRAIASFAGAALLVSLQASDAILARGAFLGASLVQRRAARLLFPEELVGHAFLAHVDAVLDRDIEFGS